MLVVNKTFHVAFFAGWIRQKENENWETECLDALEESRWGEREFLFHRFPILLVNSASNGRLTSEKAVVCIATSPEKNSFLGDSSSFPAWKTTSN